MATLTCTSCGLRGSDADAFCTRCGMSRTGAPARGSGSKSGSKVGMWIAIAAAAGFGGIVVIGILAAIAIPKFAGVSRQAKAAEAVAVMKQIRILQQEFHARHGRYTPNLDDAAAEDALTGYGDPGARYFTFAVSRATADELCIEARPSAEGDAAGLVPTSMNKEGVQYAGPGCTGPSVEEWQSGTAEEITRGSEARPTLVAIHALQARFREQHGRFASKLSDPADPDHLTGWTEPEMAYFSFVVTWATTDEFCVEAHPTPAGKQAGVASTSIDQAGQLYLGLGCTGTRMSAGSGTSDPVEP